MFFKFDHPCHLLYLLCYLYLPNMFLRSYFLCFTQFGGSSYCLNFDKFRNTAPLKSKLQPCSKRLGTPKEMRRENTPCLLKSYLTCYKCLEMLLKEPVSAVPPPLSNVGCVEKDLKPWRQHWTGGDGGGRRKNASFSPVVALMSQEFWPGL